MAVTEMRNEANQDKNDTISRTLENKCFKCSVKIRDIKLIKAHFWGVHIRREDQLSALKVLRTKEPFKLNALRSNSPAPSSTTASCSTMSEASSKVNNVKRLKRKSSASPKSKSATCPSVPSVKIDFYPCNIQELNSLPREELKYYNLLRDEYDEAKIAQRTDTLYSNKVYNKSKYFFILHFILFLVRTSLNAVILAVFAK
jgi:hypothetical protein